MSRKSCFLVASLLLVIAGYNTGYSQTREPITFEGILRLPDFGLTSQQIADQITESGLAFDVTTAQIDSLRKLGFDNVVINAVRQYYRMGTLRLLVSPPAVNVYIDNELQGTTDMNGSWQKEITRGIHNIKLAKDGYADKDSSVTVIKDQMLNVRFALSPRAVAARAPAYNFYGRYGISLSYGFGITPPQFSSEGKWKSGNNIILSGKANLYPYIFVDLDLNLANFSDFDPQQGNDYGSLNALNFTIVPGVYKEFKDKFRGYLGLGLEINSSKIENGKFESDGVLFAPDENGSKMFFALMTKVGAEALVQKNIFLFAEYRGYSVLGQYSMGFIAVGAGAYFR